MAAKGRRPHCRRPQQRPGIRRAEVLRDEAAGPPGTELPRNAVLRPSRGVHQERRAMAAALRCG
eukprot:4479034-Lingulodinium_polyedra.AAC.1